MANYLRNGTTEHKAHHNESTLFFAVIVCGEWVDCGLPTTRKHVIFTAHLQIIPLSNWKISHVRLARRRHASFHSWLSQNVMVVFTGGVNTKHLQRNKESAKAFGCAIISWIHLNMHTSYYTVHVTRYSLPNAHNSCQRRAIFQYQIWFRAYLCGGNFYQNIAAHGNIFDKTRHHYSVLNIGRTTYSSVSFHIILVRSPP